MTNTKPRFAVGDVVRCIDGRDNVNLIQGGVAVVISTGDEMPKDLISVRFFGESPNDDTLRWLPERFELIAEPTDD